MSIIVAKCKNCGANLEIEKEKGKAICPICNTSYILEDSINDITNNISNENHISNSVVNIYENNTVKLDKGIYEGESKSGIPHGHGTCIYSNGDKYEGNWFAGARNGQGKYTYSDGNEWIGEWKNDWEWTGKGFVKWNNDCVYNGELIDGKANGWGIMTYNDGKRWIGEWKDSQEWNGKGDYVLSDENNQQTGQVYSGELINGKPQDGGEWHFNGYWNKYDIQNDVLVGYYGDEEQLKIPKGVHRIKKGIGIDLYDVSSITLPDTIMSIPEGVFKHPENVEEFVGLGIKKIPNDMFNGWSNLQKISFPKAVEIGQRAFKGCNNLLSVDVPNTKKIEDSAFSDCENLSEVDFPKLKIVEEHVFSGCENLVNINVPNLEIISECAFLGCSAITSFVGPSVLELHDSAFGDCENLTSVSCPKAKFIIPTDSWCDGPFGGCTKLNDITIADNIERIEESKSKSDIKKQGCYIATALYGSYDCPQVWTLRRYRDNQLAKTWYGRLFIHAYYAISPTIVKWFGNTEWFKEMWMSKLDHIVTNLQSKGVESTPYEDKKW